LVQDASHEVAPPPLRPLRHSVAGVVTFLLLSTTITLDRTNWALASPWNRLAFGSYTGACLQPHMPNRSSGTVGYWSGHRIRYAWLAQAEHR